MNSDRIAFYAIVTCLIGYEIITAVQHRGNTVSEICWQWPWWVRVVLAIVAAHLVLPGGIANYLKSK